MRKIQNGAFWNIWESGSLSVNKSWVHMERGAQEIKRWPTNKPSFPYGRANTQKTRIFFCTAASTGKSWVVVWGQLGLVNSFYSLPFSKSGDELTPIFEGGKRREGKCEDDTGKKIPQFESAPNFPENTMNTMLEWASSDCLLKWPCIPFPHKKRCSKHLFRGEDCMGL